MSYLAKQEILQKISSVIEIWKEPPFRFPTFCVELDYVGFFNKFLPYISAELDGSFIHAVNAYLEEAIQLTILNICRTLDQNEADGSMIWHLLDERKLILRRYRLAYSKQLVGKGPKGLQKNDWLDYNHWILASIFWKAILRSHHEEFKVIIPHDADQVALKHLLSDEAKVLWSMMYAFEDVGKPLVTYCATWDSIDLHPFGTISITV